MKVIIMTVMIIMCLNDRSLCTPPPPCRRDDGIFNGRPIASQEEPIRALHSAMLHIGIDDTML